MRSFIFATLFTLSTARVFFPHGAYPPHNATNATACLSGADASLIATDFGLTISNYSEASAIQLFAEGFTDQSDSVNTLIYEPGLQASDLGSLTFSSKAAFLAGQGGQPSVPFEILNLWNTCNTVIIRWISRQSPLPVQGISIAEVQRAIEGEGGGVGVGNQKWQIRSVVAEFNSGAWLGDLGYPECAVVANATATNATAARK